VPGPPLDDEDELDLRAYLHIVRRRWRWVAGTTVLAIAAAVLFSVQQESQYRAEATLLIRTQPADSIVSDERQVTAQDAERQLNNETEILESGAAQNAALEIYDGPLDVDSVEADVASDRSDAVEVSATASDPDEAADLVNAYVQAFIDLRRTQRVDEILAAGAEIQTQIDQLQTEIDVLTAEEADPARITPLQSQQNFYRTQLEDLELTAGLVQAGGAQVLTEATPPTEPVSPRPARNAAIAVVLGLILGIGLAFLRDYYDDSLRTVDDLERHGDGQHVAVGVIPATEEDGKISRLVTVAAPTSAPAEAYRALRTAVRFASLDRDVKIIQVTSPGLGEGKTTTVANLATVLAQAGHRVTVVDCDLRRPRIHEIFKVRLGPGFTDVLLGEVPLQRALVQAGEGIYILPAGSRPPNPSEMLGTLRTESVLDALSQQCDYVLVDSTPVLPVTDGIVLSQFVDATLLVVSARNTTRHQLRQAMSLLKQAEAPVIGYVFNRVPTGRGRYGYSYSYAYAEGAGASNGATRAAKVPGRQQGAERARPKR
jgi:capsular exopolysaccharide synthesis family protein